jgi:hypothetical protein
VCGCEPPKAQKLGFVRVQFQPEPPESFVKVPKEPRCIEVVLEAQHEVVSVAHDDHVTARRPLSPLPNPQIPRVAQTDVDQQRGYRCSLRGADVRQPQAAGMAAAGRAGEAAWTVSHLAVLRTSAGREGHAIAPSSH